MRIMRHLGTFSEVENCLLIGQETKILYLCNLLN